MTLALSTFLFTNIGGLFSEHIIHAAEKEIISHDELIEHGDFNKDETINIFDVLRAHQALLNNVEPPLDADIDNDGSFSQSDAQILQDYVLMRETLRNKAGDKTEEPKSDISTELQYPVFSTNGGDSVSLTGTSININQDVASNGNVKINGEYREDYPHISTNVGLDPFYMDYSLYNAKFSDSDIYDVFSDEINFIVEKPLVVHSDIDISKEITVSSAYMMSYNDINIDNGSINFGDAVLYSKYGDITIDSGLINLVGLIYAPNGTVKLTGNNVHVSGYIIAKNVIIESEEYLNIDPSKPLSEILGTASVEAEELSIPFEDWEYIKKAEDEVFPEIVKAQIYNNPLSVDDAWLTENYGEEVVKAYNKDMKKELVEALYIGQSEGIANYHDIIFTLDFAARYDLFEKIRLVTELPDNEPGKITIKFGESTVRTIRVAGSDFVGPLPYDCQYKWDFYLDANDNPELKNADPEDTDKKEYPIHDLPEFTKLVSGGATILEGTGSVIGAAAAGITGLAASIAESIRNACVKAGADIIVETARDTLNSRLAEIADSSLFKQTEAVTDNGVKINVGPIDVNISVKDQALNLEVSANGETIDLDSADKKAVLDSIKHINQTNPKIYKDVYEALKNGTSPSELKPIIDCINEDTDKFKTAYRRLNDIYKAYESVTDFYKVYNSYDEAVYSIKDNGKQLKDNLISCNVVFPDYCFCAHHIVAQNEPLAKQSVEILLKYEIDINSACNGVYLPGGSKTNDYSWVIDEANHFGGHSDNYLNYVNDELKKCDDELSEIEVPEDKIQEFKEMARKKVCDTLNKIRNQLLNGEIKIQNNETIK